jgi:predicted proteasome-type protease
MPIDLQGHPKDSLNVPMVRHIESGGTYFEALEQCWIVGTRQEFHDPPPPQWSR